MNIIKTGLLLTVLTMILVWIGGALGGTNGLITALVFAGIMNFSTYWWSDKLAIRMARAEPIEPEQSPQLYQMLQNLSMRAQIPLPKMYVAPNPQPNAFATGRNPEHAAVVVNEGLLRMLPASEIEGVIAHELAHVKNRDTLTMTVAATLAGAISMLGYIARFAMYSQDSRDRGNTFMAAIFAPLAAIIIQLAISRSREYEADRVGAEIAGTPLGLADALEHLEAGVARIPANIAPTQAPLYIVNPLKGGGIFSLFSTHPPIAERVRRLREMAGMR